MLLDLLCREVIPSVKELIERTKQIVHMEGLIVVTIFYQDCQELKHFDNDPILFILISSKKILSENKMIFNCVESYAQLFMRCGEVVLF